MEKTQIRYATVNDFGGRLSYRPLLHMDQKIGMAIPELWDLNAITHSAQTLRRAFEQLERAGVRIPTAFGLTADGEREPQKDWRDLLKQINERVYFLHCIVDVLLDEELRYTTTPVCVG